MPKYCYACDNCDVEFYTHHSIDELLTDCPTCLFSGSLVRIPSLISYKVSNKKTAAGQVVKEHIEEAKEEIKKEKERRRKDY